MPEYSYLALGDSYTIGEQVAVSQSFPYQLVQQLRRTMLLKSINPGEKLITFNAPEIIAKTGWTTGELLEAIGETIFLPKYDIVTLLIGVNNQYRGLPVEEFENEFEVLLKMAIQFAAGNEKKVFVLSIPDWGVTPFAKDRDKKNIAGEIDTYNNICQTASSLFNTTFIDITAKQRLNGENADFLAADGLHPSGKKYKEWATELSERILASLD